MEAHPTMLTAYLPADALGERLFVFRFACEYIAVQRHDEAMKWWAKSTDFGARPRASCGQSESLGR
jgi:hypothetical protein